MRDKGQRGKVGKGWGYGSQGDMLHGVWDGVNRVG